MKNCKNGFLIEKLIACLSAFLFFIIFVGIGGTNFINFTYRPISYLNSLLIVVFAILFLSFLFLCGYFFNKYDYLNTIQKNNLLYMWGGGMIVLVFIQFYIFSQVYFIINADTEVIVNCAAWSLDKNENWYNTIGWFNAYFSAYHNNFFVMILSSFLIRMERCFGIIDVSTHYIFITLFQSICSCISLTFLFVLLRRKINNLYLQVLGPLLYVVLICFSPWLAIPYTHQFAVGLPIIILVFYDNIKNHIWLKTSVIGLIVFSAIGYKLTPLVMIVVIAIFIIEILNILSERKIKFFLNRFSILVCIFGFIFLFGQYEKYWANKNGLNVRSDLQFGMAHYLNMGLNNPGIYNGDDVNFSYSLKTKEDLNKENLKSAKNRLKEYNFVSFTKHCLKKVFTSTADSSFGYKGCTVVVEDVSLKNEKTSVFLRNIFRAEGKYFQLMLSLKQILYCIAIISCIIASIFSFKKNDVIKSVIMLSLIGFVIYDVLFESNCHHIFSYVSFIVYFAIVGINDVLFLFRKNVEVEQ